MTVVEFTASDSIIEINKWDVMDFRLYGDSHYLRIQRNKDLKKNQFGDIHFECDGQGRGEYDVIETISVKEKKIVIKLLDTFDEHFNGRLEYRISMDINNEEYKKCLEFLFRLFEGTDFQKQIEIQQDGLLNSEQAPPPLH